MSFVNEQLKNVILEDKKEISKHKEVRANRLVDIYAVSAG